MFCDCCLREPFAGLCGKYRKAGKERNILIFFLLIYFGDLIFDFHSISLPCSGRPLLRRFVVAGRGRTAGAKLRSFQPREPPWGTTPLTRPTPRSPSRCTSRCFPRAGSCMSSAITPTRGSTWWLNFLLLKSVVFTVGVLANNIIYLPVCHSLREIRDK